MLQLWQVYHALTYQNQWKSVIQGLWDTYQTEWLSKHPDEPKPPKTHLQMMVEFMKEKYNQETNEMKAKCDEYRMSHCDNSPIGLVNENAESNVDFQAKVSSAICLKEPDLHKLVRLTNFLASWQQ